MGRCTLRGLPTPVLIIKGLGFRGPMEMPLCSGWQNSAEMFQGGPGTGDLDAPGQTDRRTLDWKD